jgi:DNA replication protein DnaC
MQLLILDDWGLELLQSAYQHELMEIMGCRHNESITARISQLPTNQWYGGSGDNWLVDAPLKRLLHCGLNFV